MPEIQVLKDSLNSLPLELKYNWEMRLSEKEIYETFLKSMIFLFHRKWVKLFNIFERNHVFSLLLSNWGK